MPQEKDKARLEDILSYTPESEFTDDELALIRQHFNGAQGAKLAKILRKVLLPTISDFSFPMEKVGQDVLMTGLDFRGMQADEIKAVVMGRQEAIKFVIGALIQLKNIANIKDETETERALRLKQNSAK